MQINKIQNNKGFTLIEALVAISILMIAIASPMTLAQKSLSTATLSKDQMIAAFLAQDGIEAVKNIRDQIAITQTSGDWLDGTLLDNCMCTGALCNFNNYGFSFCTIDSASTRWEADNPNSINAGDNSTALLRVLYNVDKDSIKTFLKYDYNNLTTCNPSMMNTTCGEDSKFTRYINIKKTSDTDQYGKNEAVVSVRVSWPSALGPQKIDIQDFIYNYSENI